MKTILILSLLNWYLFSSLTGVIDAILYSKKGADAFTWNEHIIYVAQRGLVLSLLIIGSLLNLDFNGWGLLIGSMILSFSFWHDGFYYETRRRIDVPKYKFTSVSTTSTAYFTFPFWLRLCLFIVSIWLIIALYEGMDKRN